MSEASVELSVVMPTFDAGDVIGSQLGALDAQDTTVRWELVIADNGSTDETVTCVAAAMAHSTVPVRIVDAADIRGVSHARNVGASAAAGRLLAFCDQDDRVHPGWVAAMATALATADVVVGVQRELRDPFDPQAPVLPLAAIMEACNLGITREVFFAIGGFDESIPVHGGEDSEMGSRLSLGGHRLSYRDTPIVYKRPARGTIDATRRIWRSAKSQGVLGADRLTALDRGERARVLTRSLTALPRELVAARREGAAPRDLARTAVQRTGNVVGYLRSTDHGRRPAPRLVHEPLPTRFIWSNRDR